MTVKRLPIVGWREWVSLPELGVTAIKAKIDTGARSSALHVLNIEPFTDRGISAIRFEIPPDRQDTMNVVLTQAEVLDQREVRNSGGQTEVRYAILTLVEIQGIRWPIELTLTNREAMGFRMLLGRQAVRDRFLVDPGRSFLASSNSATL
jgi:hypothetical protein